MVEPVPYVFERLRDTYGDNERIALENAAVGVRDELATIYHLAELKGEKGRRRRGGMTRSAPSTSRPCAAAPARCRVAREN